MPFLKRTPLAGLLGLLLFTAAPTLHASGDWMSGGPLSTDDLSSYTAVTGVITALNLRNKPPLIQFTSEAGEVLILLIPKTALISIGEKLVTANRLRVGQEAKLRWTEKDGFRVVGSLNVIPKAKPETNFMQGMGIPAIPRPNLTRPVALPVPPQAIQPAAPVLRESAPASSPPPPRPVLPAVPSLNQEIRR